MTVYEIITNRILEKLEKGTLPFIYRYAVSEKQARWRLLKALSTKLKCSYWFVSNYFNRSIDRLKIMESQSLLNEVKVSTK